ncbi:MAG: DVU_1553 family AMP-dependent CoA ligase [Syntrophobacteraceae bacterium]|jgi:phenylacetate-coenzyme A ligase PaaK-like adenylate-forming protein
MKITPLEGWISQHIGANGARLSRERIEACQLGRLRETIDWAKARSPFYRERLASVSGRDLSSLEDLARFPFTTDEDIRRQPLRFLCVSQSEVSRVVTLQTSGTTGDPKRIFFTADDQERTIDFFHHGMATLTGPGERILILLPGALPGSVGDLLVKGLERLGAVGVPHGLVRQASQTLAVMEKERIDTLVGIPTQVLGLARFSGGRAAPGSVLLSTDHVPDAVSKEFRRIWGCEVYTHYGMTEMGFGGGVECEARKGYHLREADLYIEIADPGTGSPVSEGKPGEVVFTTLTRRGMPLIRYRTGDVSRFVPDPCPCGTVLKTLARVKNRLRSICPLAQGGCLSMADLDEAIFPVEGVVDFSASLTREKGPDRLRIKAQVTRPDNRRASAEIQEALNTLPVIRSALRGGALTLDVSLLPEGHALTRDSAKRVLLDLRD